jgi:DNA-binding transcriptional ArsR family regulator
MTSAISSRHSPRSLAPAQLERLTVAREELLARIQRVVSDAALTGQARFDLLIGPRGAGKSHFIGLLEARLRASARLAERAIVVALPEARKPTSLVALLAAILREFPEDPEVGPAADAVRSLERQQDANQEQRAVDLIRGRLDGRTLIILLENLDELFDMLGRAGQQRLRNILQTQRRWSIVATSRSLSPAFVKYEAPFHGTFNQHTLEPLSPEGCRDMLAKLADAHGRSGLAEALRTGRGLARVRGIHHLLGGNPRAMAHVFRHLDEQRLDSFELLLPDLADELEPCFREQLTLLSPAQRAIVELLAQSWRPLTVTEIAEREFMGQASVSGALRHLRHAAVVRERKIGREHLYELDDPLHRLVRANQGPREAVEAFARCVRWSYGEGDESTLESPYRYGVQTATATAAADGPAARATPSMGVPDVMLRAWHRGEPLDGPSPGEPASPRELDSPAMVATIVERFSLHESEGDEELSVEQAELLSDLLPLVVPFWLASRRSPRRLWQLAQRASATRFLAMFPGLQSDSPRSAVARLSQPERELIRRLLHDFGDDEGLAELGLLEASNAASAAPRSRG